MRVLIDTHIAIWAMLDDSQLSQTARGILLDKDNEIYYSVASIWEITIKHLTHPTDFLYDGKYLSEACNDNGFFALPIMLSHTFMLSTLKKSEGAPRHKDPFDQLLIAQAKAEDMKLLTHDSKMQYYGEECVISV